MTLTTLRNLAIGSALLCAPALADGNEKLGPASITIQKGTHIIHGGVGMNGTASASFDIQVPANATIKQVIAYWEGMHNGENSHGATDALTIGGQAVTGNRIGGASRFFSTVWSSSYRADITSLNIVGSGTTTVTIAGMDFDYANDGFGLMVIVDDGSGLKDIQVQDGNDTAYYFFGNPRKFTEPVTYNFAPHTAPRTASLGFHLGDVEANRTTHGIIKIDGVIVKELYDAFAGQSGGQWDVLSVDVTVPAGATSITVEVQSFDTGLGRFAGSQEASLVWVASSLLLAPPPSKSNNNCSVGYWLKNTNNWPCRLTPSVKVGRLFGLRPGFPRFAPNLANRTLIDVLENGGNGASDLEGKAGDLMQQAVAAYLNACSRKCRTLSTRCLVFRVRIILSIVNCNPTRGKLIESMTNYLDKLNSRCCKPSKRCGSKKRRCGSSRKCRSGSSKGRRSGSSSSSRSGSSSSRSGSSSSRSRGGRRRCR